MLATFPYRPALLLLTILIGAFQGVWLHHGHDWGDDFAAYLTNARNLAEQRPYGESGYIYNPQYPTLGPSLTSPGFPLLLAPLYAAFGPNLLVLKVVGLGSLMVIVWCTGQLLIRFVPPVYALGGALFVGLHPLVGQLVNQIMSDLPFTALLLAALCGLLRIHDNRSLSLRAIIVTALAMVGTLLIRPIGVVVPAMLLGHDLLRFRRVSRSTILILGVAGVVLVPYFLWFPTDSTHSDRLPNSVAEVMGNVRSVGWGIVAMWQVFNNQALTITTATAVLLATLWGFGLAVRRSATILEYFCVGYVLALILLIANMHTRYLVPLLPFVAMYSLITMQYLRTYSTWVSRLAAGLGIFLLGVYVTITPQLAPTVQSGVTANAPHAMFAYIRTETEPTDLIIFRKPRALHFFTDRRSAVWHHGNDQELLAYFQEIGATHALTGPSGLAQRVEDLVRRQPTYFSLLYTAGDFRLYRFFPDAEYIESHDEENIEARQ